MKLKFELRMSGNTTEYVHIEPATVFAGANNTGRLILLPGQLGFSILFATLFGIALYFFGLREQLVLKRFMPPR